MEPLTNLESGTKQISLLSLPPEIRNLIYEYTALEAGALAINHNTIAAPALAFACRQTRHEYLPLFRASRFTRVKKIEALVYDFNFRPLARLLMRTSDSGGQAYVSRCKLLVTIIASDADAMRSHSKVVTRWRASLLAGLLGSFNCEYVIRPNYHALGSGGRRVVVNILALLRHREDYSLLRLSSSSNPLEKWFAKELNNRGLSKGLVVDVGVGRWTGGWQMTIGKRPELEMVLALGPVRKCTVSTWVWA